MYSESILIYDYREITDAIIIHLPYTIILYIVYIAWLLYQIHGKIQYKTYDMFNSFTYNITYYNGDYIWIYNTYSKASDII